MNKKLCISQTSIGRKQLVALSGLALALFLLAHLGGNIFFYFGPEAFNAYAKKLHSLGPLLWVMRIGLLSVFLIHVYFTFQLVRENINARKTDYNQFAAKQPRSLATQLMPYTATIILVYIVFHIIDFTIADKSGARSILFDGESYGIYGIVFNSFTNPLHSLFYILALLAIWFHLNHGLSSIVQTLGFNAQKIVKAIGYTISMIICGGFISIPVYVMIISRG